MNLSKNCTLAEATKSATAIKYGIDNNPDDQQLANMKLAAQDLFQKVRDHFDHPIAITSFFRSPELNSRIGGSKTSQHCKGMAIDMDADVYRGMTNAEIFHYIKDNLDFDQLIWEYGTDSNPDWVHASYVAGANRKQVLKVSRVGGKSQYALWSE